MYKEYNKQLMDILIKKGPALTREQLASEIGITRPTLNRFMNNQKIYQPSLLRILQWMESLK